MPLMHMQLRSIFAKVVAVVILCVGDAAHSNPYVIGSKPEHILIKSENVCVRDDLDVDSLAGIDVKLQYGVDSSSESLSFLHYGKFKNGAIAISEYTAEDRLCFSILRIESDEPFRSKISPGPSVKAGGGELDTTMNDIKSLFLKDCVRSVSSLGDAFYHYRYGVTVDDISPDSRRKFSQDETLETCDHVFARSVLNFYLDRGRKIEVTMIREFIIIRFSTPDK